MASPHKVEKIHRFSGESIRGIRVIGTNAYVEVQRKSHRKRLMLQNFSGKCFTKPETLDRYIAALQAARDWLAPKPRGSKDPKDAFEVLSDDAFE